jgi:hypothetical protein
METLRGQVHLHQGDVFRQNRIQRPLELGQWVPPPSLKGDNLPPGVDPPVGSSSTDHPCIDASNILQCPLNLALNRSLVRLDLKPVKVCPVVLDPGPDLEVRCYVPRTSVRLGALV